MSSQFETLKTGDIILFIASAQWIMNSSFLGNIYTHIGMVVKKGDKLYCAETGSSGARYKPNKTNGEPVQAQKGSCLIPLMTRLKYYNGQTCFMQLKHALSPESEQKILEAAQEKTYYPTVWQIIKGYFGMKTKGTAHCAQYIGRLLDAGGLVPINEENFEDSSFIEIYHRIVDLPKKVLRNHNTYLDPYLALYDIDI